MSAFEDAAKTFRELECELERLDDTYDINKLDQVEMRTVRILQLLEVQIGSIGAELYSAVKQRRARIQRGEFSVHTVAEETIREVTKEEGPLFEEKPAPKKKKTTRKKKSA